MTEFEKTTKVARINQVDILLIGKTEKRVAIKPICEALGVSHQKQIERLKSDPILGSTVTLRVTVGADKKEREMMTIPFKYVFGWLFRIDSRNVKEESREMVLKYQLMCYDALYHHFTSYADFVEQKQSAIETQLSIVDNAKTGFKSAKYILDDANGELFRLRKLTFDDFDAENRQLKMFSENQMTN